MWFSSKVLDFMGKTDRKMVSKMSLYDQKTGVQRTCAVYNSQTKTGCLTTTVAFSQVASAGLDGGATAGVTCGITWPASLLGACSTCNGTLRPFRPRRPAIFTVFSCTHINVQAHLALLTLGTIHLVLTPPHPSWCSLLLVYLKSKGNIVLCFWCFGA